MQQKIEVLFMGRKRVGANALKHTLSLSETRVVGVLTDSHLAGSATTDVAKEYGIPVFNHNELEKQIRDGEFTYDLGLSVLYWRKLSSVFIETPRLGNINFHPAPLPQYKGTAGYNMAIMDELSNWGVTAHYVDENIDTGGIVEVSLFPIEHINETAQSLENKTRPIILELFKRTLERAIEQGTTLKTTPNIGGRYISRTEMESMKKINEGDDINKKIRAFWFPPYDGAFTIIHGEKFTLLNKFILKKVIGSDDTCLFDENSNELKK